MDELPSLVFTELIKFFLYCFRPFGGIEILYCTGIGLKFFNVKLGRTYKLVLISGIYQIDSSYQNFERVFML